MRLKEDVVPLARDPRSHRLWQTFALPPQHVSVGFDPETGELAEVRFDVAIPNGIGHVHLRVRQADGLSRHLAGIRARSVADIERALVLVEVLDFTARFRGFSSERQACTT